MAVERKTGEECRMVKYCCKTKTTRGKYPVQSIQRERESDRETETQREKRQIKEKDRNRQKDREENRKKLRRKQKKRQRRKQKKMELKKLVRPFQNAKKMVKMVKRR